jgi:hypothetical protein
MEDFSITTRLTEKEYSKLMYVGLYRKPGIIVATFLGLFIAVTLILDHLRVINYYSETPYFEVFGGLFLLLLPTIIVQMSLKQLRSNASYQHSITYIFGEKGIRVQGLTFNAEFQWSHIIKRKEIGKFLILYHSKKLGNFVDKTKLTTEQLEFIRGRVKDK